MLAIFRPFKDFCFFFHGWCPVGGVSGSGDMVQRGPNQRVQNFLPRVFDTKLVPSILLNL